MSPCKQYLRAPDIAQLTGTSVRTVRRWIADETIPSKRLGGARLVAKTELQRLLSPLSLATDECEEDNNE